MVTLVMFMYYANDITAKMTAGSPPHRVRTFQDVLDYGYKVIVAGTDYELLLPRVFKFVLMFVVPL